MDYSFRDRIRTSRAAADVSAGKRAWFRFEAKGLDETEVFIYDEIGFFGITASDFLRELNQVRTNSIALHLNSVGGDVFDGIAIYNGLKHHRAKVSVTVDGIAASIASVIAMAGDSVTMNQGSMMMIHEPFALVIGDSRDMRKQADALDLMGDNIAGIYASRAGNDAASWRDLMRAETWYGADEAVKAGLATAVSDAPAAKNAFDLSIFRHPPGTKAAAEAPRETTPEPLARDWRYAARFEVATAQLTEV